MTKSEASNKLKYIFLAKNHDYGCAAHDTFRILGEVSYIVRLYDKLNRLTQLLSGEESQVKDESILDTIGDAVTYLCMLSSDLECNGLLLPEIDKAYEYVDRTAQRLDDLKYSDRRADELYTVKDIADHKKVLLQIWEYVEDPHERILEYTTLAEMLFAEYVLRSE